MKRIFLVALLSAFSLPTMAHDVLIKFTPSVAKLIANQYVSEVELCFSGPSKICVYSPGESAQATKEATIRYKNPSLELSIIDAGNDPSDIIDAGNDPSGVIDIGNDPSGIIDIGNDPSLNIVDTGSCPHLESTLSCKFQISIKNVEVIEKLQCPITSATGRCF